MNRKSAVALILFGTVVLALAAFWWYSRALLGSLSPATLRQFLLQWGFWQGAAIYFLIYTFSIRPFVPIPPTLYTLTGGLVFGPVVGTVLTVLAATTNASITFVIGRSLGKEWVERRLGPKWKKAQEALHGGGFKAVLLIRLSPVGLPFDLVSYAAGLLGVRFQDYFLGTLLGILPVTAAYSYFGGSLTRGAVGILAAIFGIALVSMLLPWIWKRWRGRRRKSNDAPMMNDE
ncbi:MAG: TVP38/TMEM64 family protein [Acidobacteria bacterium]|nr:TVP38/TMEM64 family protein [Acidobacteriota bacterium]